MAIRLKKRKVKMKPITYFQTRKYNYTTTKNCALSTADAHEFIKKLILQNPNAIDADEVVKEDIKIYDTSTFVNGVLVRALANSWVIKELKERPEIEFN